jgi:hypothetical protein
MISRRSEDILWVAEEVADLAVLLRSHGVGHLASRLDQVHSALQSMHVASWKNPTLRNGTKSAKVVVLELFRKQLQQYRTLSHTEGDAC